MQIKTVSDYVRDKNIKNIALKIKTIQFIDNNTNQLAHCKTYNTSQYNIECRLFK